MYINSKTRENLVLWSAAFICFVLFLLLLEACSYFILKFIRHRTTSQSMSEFIQGRPAPFINSKDFDVVFKSQFSEDAPKCTGVKVIQKFNDFPKYSNDILCQGFNVLDGVRKTYSQPSSYENVVYFFGGSTMFGTGSSDEFTIPSIVQKKLIEKFASKYKVVNYGFSAVVVKQQLLKLKSIKLKKNDVVVFYDGGNDLFQGVVYGAPQKTIIEYNKEHKAELYLYKLKSYFKRRSNFYNLIEYIKEPSSKLEKCNIGDEFAVKERVSQTIDQYVSTLNEADQITKTKGAKFFHIFQPTLFSKSSPFSKYETNMIETMLPCEELAPLKYGYIEFKKLYDNTPKSFIDFNYADLLDPITQRQEYFLDWVHVSSVGNNRIADSIFHDLFLHD